MTEWIAWSYIATLLMPCTFGMIARWTNPKIEGSHGRGVLVPSVLEERYGRTGIFVHADMAHAHYFVLYQKFKNLFALNETTGEIRVNAGVTELDTETGDDKYILVIWAKGDEFTTGTATATVLIEDLNDNAPTFDKPLYNLEVRDGSGYGVTIATITATDIDTTLPNNDIVYSFADGNDQKTFTIDRHSGVISVRQGKVVGRDVTPAYNLTLSAVDQGRPPLTGTTKLSVLVSRASGRSFALFSVMLPVVFFVM